MWSGNHEVNLVLADKSLFFLSIVHVYHPITICGPMYSCHSKMILLERKNTLLLLDIFLMYIDWSK